MGGQDGYSRDMLSYDSESNTFMAGLKYSKKENVYVVPMYPYGVMHSTYIGAGFDRESPILKNAYRAARQARFEYGQVGAPSEWD